MAFKFFADFKPWLGSTDLYIQFRSYDRKTYLLAPGQLIETSAFAKADEQKPFLGQSVEQVHDGLAEVDQFLQAAMDCAWERGMRPTGFKDVTHELSAVRYHLEDMRKLTLMALTKDVTVRAEQ